MTERGYVYNIPMSIIVAQSRIRYWSVLSCKHPNLRQ